MESSDNLASRHNTFTYHWQYYSMVDISFLWEGGVNILWYNILTPPPPKNILEQYLYMESSDNLALTQKTFTFHRQYYYVVDLSYLWDVGGGGQYILV